MFPGQGSQLVGMGLDFYESFPDARAVYERADDIVGFPLSEICFHGPEDQLGQTENAQPAIFVTSIVCLACALKSNCLSGRPRAVAGHSLGEYTALVAAGSLTFEDGLRLVRRRGQLTGNAGDSQGAMAALLRIDDSGLQAICEATGVEVCNYNSPEQTVVGGSSDAIEAAIAAANVAGGRGVRLRVSGAFHTSLMAPAAQKYALDVGDARIVDPRIPVIANTDAEPLSDGLAVRRELVAQLTGPVLWRQTVEMLGAAGVTCFMEFGPGQVLSGLVKRTLAHAVTPTFAVTTDLDTKTDGR